MHGAVSLSTLMMGCKNLYSEHFKAIDNKTKDLALSSSPEKNSNIQTNYW